jgi:hypothetical protein
MSLLDKLGQQFFELPTPRKGGHHDDSFISSTDELILQGNERQPTGASKSHAKAEQQPGHDATKPTNRLEALESERYPHPLSSRDRSWLIRALKQPGAGYEFFAERAWMIEPSADYHVHKSREFTAVIQRAVAFTILEEGTAAVAALGREDPSISFKFAGKMCFDA